MGEGAKWGRGERETDGNGRMGEREKGREGEKREKGRKNTED
jgi:hypothetical protein